MVTYVHRMMVVMVACVHRATPSHSLTLPLLTHSLVPYLIYIVIYSRYLSLFPSLFVLLLYPLSPFFISLFLLSPPPPPLPPPHRILTECDVQLYRQVGGIRDDLTLHERALDILIELLRKEQV